MKESPEINDIIIAEDYNHNTAEKEVRLFYAEIGVCDIHHKVNNISLKELDKTYINGSNLIDSIAAMCGIMEYIEGYKLLGYNEIVESDYRAYMIDIVIEKYFEEELNT